MPEMSTFANDARWRRSRREFLKQVGLWSAGALLVPPVFDIGQALGAPGGGNPELIVGRGKDYAALTRQVIQEMGGMAAFVSKGSTVVIKPNIGWDRNVDQGANTHPEVVAALALMAVEAGAGEVRVFDRTCNEERRCYQNSGIKPALEDLGERKIQCRYMDERKYVPVTIKNGRALKEWPFYKDALEADCYINVPVAKHHSSTGLSLGLKNAMGVIGGWRGKLHYELSPKIADLNLVIRPALTLVDATRIMIRNGPSGGSLDDVRQMDTLVGGVDPVAVDAYATTLFGMKPQDLQTTVEAAQRGLGQMDLNQCRIREIRV